MKRIAAGRGKRKTTHLLFFDDFIFAFQIMRPLSLTTIGKPMYVRDHAREKAKLMGKKKYSPSSIWVS